MLVRASDTVRAILVMYELQICIVMGQLILEYYGSEGLLMSLTELFTFGSLLYLIKLAFKLFHFG